MPRMTEHLLSQLAQDIIAAGTYANLVVREGTPARAHELLDGVTPEKLLTEPISSIGHAYAMLAGFWLWLDALKECHEIAQMDAGALRALPHAPSPKDLVVAANSLDFWHAIMHRREGDFSNAKYWYARCDTHHVIRMMGAAASSLAGEHSSDRLVAHALSGGWNAEGFVDLVQAVHNKPGDPRHDLAVRLQQIEWQALFGYCVREAVGADHGSLDDWDRRVNGPSGG